MLEHSEGEYDIIVIEIMKELRSVSWHWSSWSSRAIEVLRPPNDLLETLLEIVAERFVNVRSLILDNIRKIDDEYLTTLSNCQL